MRSAAPHLTAKTAWLVFFLLAIFFFLSHHQFRFPFEEGYVKSADFLEETEMEGNPLRRISFLSLGLLGGIALLARGRGHFRFGDPLGLAYILYALWALASVMWSPDVGMTVRRLAGFLISGVAALAMVCLLPARIVPRGILFISTLYLVIGLSVEIAAGVFHPFSPDYRFAGTVHPNMQGLNCALMFLAAVSLSGGEERGKPLFLAAAAVSLVALILTGSRTSFFGVLFAQTAFFFLFSSRSRIFGWCLGIAWIATGLLFFQGERILPIFSQAIFLGRESGEIATLTGRTDIWDACLAYVVRHPLHGYGFQSFWNPAHIRELSAVVGTGINTAHSAYLDLTLSLGLVGFASFVTVLFLGTRGALRRYRTSPGEGHRFLFLFFVFSSFYGLTESEIVEFTSLTALVLLWGVSLLAFGVSSEPGEETASGEFPDTVREG